jgi:hypothetical protein
MRLGGVWVLELGTSRARRRSAAPPESHLLTLSELTPKTLRAEEDHLHIVLRLCPTMKRPPAMLTLTLDPAAFGAAQRLSLVGGPLLPDTATIPRSPRHNAPLPYSPQYWSRTQATSAGLRVRAPSAAPAATTKMRRRGKTCAPRREEPVYLRLGGVWVVEPG